MIKNSPLNKLLLFSLIFLTTSLSYAQSPDFRVQHLQDDVPNLGGINTTFTPVCSLSKAFILADNNRMVNAGRSDLNGSNLNGNDVAGARVLSATNTVSYFRESGSNSNPMRFNSTIWEYIGPSGGANEFIIRGRYVVSLNGSTNNITQAVFGIANANKCIPFITGIMNNSTSQDADSGTAVAYLENATTLRVQKGTNTNNVTIYITLVEFTGSNWNVLHGDSGNVGSDTGTINLTDSSTGSGVSASVPAWNKAIIFGQHRGDINSSGVNDALADNWPLFQTGTGLNNIKYTFNSNHVSDGSNRQFVHVLTNANLNVSRFSDTSNSADESIVNILAAGLTDLAQAFLVGSSITSGTGNAYARGWRNYYFKSLTEAAHWSHRSGNTMNHEIQIIDLSNLKSMPSGPEINLTGNGISIASGSTTVSASNNTDFGNLIVGGSGTSKTFTIQNLGTTNLTLTNPSPYIQITGNTTDFTLSANPSSTIAAGSSSTFTILFKPTVLGVRTVTISIGNNDSTGCEDPYTFVIQGTGINYCSSNGNDTSFEYISNVQLNSINKTSGAGVTGYSDFTSTSTNLTIGNLYTITIGVNRTGIYTEGYSVWIDYNQNGVFTDAGEKVFTSGPINAASVSGSFTIPSAAVSGNTRMRVSMEYNTIPNSCGSFSYGEVEDYTVNILKQTITTGVVSPTSYCKGAPINIPYTVTGTFNTGNIFTAQLSDATGSFATPVNIGTLSAVSAGTISGTIPISTINGSGYRIRVVGSNPVITGSVNGSNLTINPIPGSPTTIGAEICIGSTGTLAASGAIAGEKYLWYDAATGGILLKTSTNNTDNTYTTPPISATTNYWVSILNSGGCESGRTSVTASIPVNSPDSQIVSGTDTWVGHIYDGTNFGVAYSGNFTNYYGTSTESETFDESFGGATTCYGINSSLGNRSIYTETFSARYRMNSTKKGLYVVDLGSDDGSRLQIDGNLVYNNWSDQAWSSKPRVLINLTGNSNLTYDFYENGGQNRVVFNNLIPILSNTLTTNTTQNICLKDSGLAISGDTFGTLPSGISKSGTGYQWAYSTSSTGPWTNITGATSATYTPTTSAAPFNVGGTFYIVRKASLSSTNNVSPNPYVATNQSNAATITVISLNTWNGSSSSDWNTDANWSCKVPTVTNNLDVLIPSGLTTYPILSSGANGYIENIEFQTGSTLNVIDNYLQITQNIKLNGKIDLQGQSQLLQNEGSVLDVTSSGSIEIDQQGTSDNFKYNYWSSPVSKPSTSENNAGFSIKTVLRDATDPNNIKNIDFGASYTYADGVVTSPIKLSSYWMYKYKNKPADDYNAWEAIGENGNLSAGEGFTMKGSNTNLSEQNYTFVGKPNNGTISLILTSGKQYLIGNPYPSAIDAKQFIKDNIAVPFGNRTENVINGTLYFWDHFGGGTHYLKSYEGGYGVYNLVGSVPAIANNSLINNTFISSLKGAPQQFIPVAQGFFVQAASDLVSDADIQFRNDQRVFQTESPTTSIFFKNSKTSIQNIDLTEDNFPKIYLSYDSPKNYHRELLVGFIPQTTDSIDLGYDALLNEANEEDMYWKAGANNLLIQAVGTIDNGRVLPIEIKTAFSGLNKISIKTSENLPSNIQVFVKDAVLGETFNITNNPFEIVLDAGTYSNRFALTFKTNKKTDIVDNNFETRCLVYMDNANSAIQIKINDSTEIKSVRLYNYIGQLIKTWSANLNKNTISIPVKFGSGVYIVKVVTAKGSINKKIIIE